MSAFSDETKLSSIPFVGTNDRRQLLLTAPQETRYALEGCASKFLARYIFRNILNVFALRTRTSTTASSTRLCESVSRSSVAASTLGFLLGDPVALSSEGRLWS